MDTLETFGGTAKTLARNPIGIIALFIVLIYGFASLVVVLGNNLSESERLPIIWFLVVFPVVVLAVFSWLVIMHHTKLYAPSDYQDDDAFLQASRTSLEAAISIGAAQGKWASQNPHETVSLEDIEVITKNIAGQIAKASHHGRQQLDSKRVLWVDDRPPNNVYERRSLEALGIKFTIALSTEDALAKISKSEFDAIISDMGRPPDKQAGYTLLKSLRSQDYNIPFIIYAGSRSPKHIAEAKEKGAQGTTNRPDELFEMVLREIGLD